jgi:hypothetical protein
MNTFRNRLKEHCSPVRGQVTNTPLCSLAMARKACGKRVSNQRCTIKSWESSTHIVRVNVTVRESHRVIRVVHHLAADPTNKRRVDVMRERDFSSQDAQILGTSRAIDIALRMFGVVV